jgi:DMSO/TMAO reductase YedYZ molybdopterin-dependent catalytic subunit
MELGGVPRLPTQDVTVDIHCVTKWSKLDTAWQGVSVDTLLELAGHDGPFAMAHCDGAIRPTCRWRT